MLLSLLFVSTFAAGAGAVAVAVGVLGLSTGMALVHPPLTNAAAASLPEEEVGGGIGIFQGLLRQNFGEGPLHALGRTGPRWRTARRALARSSNA